MASSAFLPPQPSQLLPLRLRQATTAVTGRGLGMVDPVAGPPTRRRSSGEPIRLCGARPRDTSKAWTALRSSTKSAGGPARPVRFETGVGVLVRNVLRQLTDGLRALDGERLIA